MEINFGDLVTRIITTAIYILNMYVISNIYLYNYGTNIKVYLCGY